MPKGGLVKLRPPDRLARLVGVALLLVGVGCRAEAEAPLPSPPPSVALTMREMRFEHASSLPRGRVVFHVHNAGGVPHRLIMVPLAPNDPPIAEQLIGPARRLEPQAGIPDQRPGDNTTFAANLEPGRYAFLCLVIDPDGKSHALKGMTSEFRVP